jgi:hypothetical protein
MQAALQNNWANMLRQDPSLIGAESHKMLPVINLKMRKLPSVESLCHKVHVGTAALGCPRSEAPLVLILLPRRAGFNSFGRARKKNVPSWDSLAVQKNKASFARPDSRGPLSPHDLENGETAAIAELQRS